MVAGRGVHGCHGGCMVARGHVWLPGGVHGCLGHAWLPGGVHGCQGACMVAPGVEGMCGCWGGHAWLPGGYIGYDEIRSMSGRYASYWNAFLFLLSLKCVPSKTSPKSTGHVTGNFS